MTAPRDTYLIEQRLLATTLKTGEFCPTLAIEDFSYADHRTLFRQMLDCRDDLGGLSTVAFGDWLQSVVGVDLRAWLTEFEAEASAHPELMPSYVDMLHRVNASGELRRTLDRLPELNSDDPEELKREAIRALESVTTAAPLRKVRSVSAVLPEVLSELDRLATCSDLPGVPSGLPRLDEMTGGFHPGDLSILAARPAVGKTALMLNMALHAARCGKRVGVFSCEQPIEQITLRLLAMHSRVPAWLMRNPKRLDDAQWSRIVEATKAIQGLPIVVNDDSAPSVERLLAYARSMEVDIILVDYIQRLKALKTSTIFERVSAVALALKEMARECNVPVLALAQINRAGAQGARMEHLKGSGDIEQEADVVMILERLEDNDTQGKLTLEKNRHGPTGELALVFNAAILEFREMAPHHADRDRH